MDYLNSVKATVDRMNLINSDVTYSLHNEKIIRGNYLNLLVISICSIIIDIFCILSIILQGVLVAPLILLIVCFLGDGLVFASIKLLNLKVFKHRLINLGITTAVIVINIVALLVINNNGMIISNIALSIQFIVHIFFVFNILLGHFILRRSNLKNKNLSYISYASSGLLILILLISIFASGFFGQNNLFSPNRTIVYDEISDGTLAASKVLPGFGKKVSIPKTYNGKKVTAVDYNLFDIKDVEEYYLADYFKFSGYNKKFQNIDREFKIFTETDYYDKYRKVFYDSYLSYKEQTIKETTSIVFNLYPKLDNDTKYVNIDQYNEPVFKSYSLSFIPTFYFKKGEKIKSSELLGAINNNLYQKRKDYDYLWNKTDLTYKYSMNDIVIGTNVLENDLIAEDSYQDIPLTFSKIYKFTFLKSKPAVDNYSPSINNTTRYVTDIDSDYTLSYNRPGCTYQIYLEDTSSLFNLHLNDIYTDEFNIRSIVNFAKASSMAHNTYEFIIRPGYSLEYGQFGSNVGALDNYIYGDDIKIEVTDNFNERLIKTYSLYRDSPRTLISTQSSNIFDLGIIPASSNLAMGNRYSVELLVVDPDYSILNTTISVIKTIMINKKSLQVTFSSITEKVFDNTNYLPEFDIDGLENDDVITPTDFSYYLYGSAGYADYIKFGGDYDCRVELKNTAVNNNYQLVGNTLNYRVNKKEVDAIWNIEEKIYNPGVPYSPTATAVLLDTTYQFDKLEKTDAGTYEMSLKFASPHFRNYEVSLSTKTRYFTISKRDIYNPIVWANETITYDGTYQKPIASINTGTSEGTLWLTVNNQQMNAGSYLVDVSNNLKNYTILTPLTTTFVILPRSVDVHWDNASLTKIYNGETQSAIAYILDPFSSRIYLSVTNSISANVGTYQVTASNTDSNYTLNLNKDVNIIINKKSVVMAFDVSSKVYNGNIQYHTYHFDGKVGSDTIDLQPSLNPVNVGTYTVVYTNTNNNYLLNSESNTATSSFTITKKEVTVYWTVLTKEYNKLAQTPDYSISGAVNEEILSINFTSNQTSPGSKLLLGSLNSSNYKFSTGDTISVTFTVSKAKLTVNWLLLSKTYTGSPLLPNYSITGLIDADQEFLTFSSQPVNAGSHSLDISLSSTYYELNSTVNKTVTFTITPAPVSVNWDVMTFVYSGYSVSPEYSFNGVLNGDSLVISPFNQYTDFGTYSYTIENNSPNYLLGTDNTATGELIINRKVIYLSNIFNYFAYDGQEHLPTFTVEGGYYMDGTIVEIWSNPESQPGQHYIAVGIINNNYEFDGHNEAFTIRMDIVIS